MQNHIGILGGTFDPIHEGHLAIANHVLQTLPLTWVEFIPCFLPPHRDVPIASPEDRLAMVKLAINHFPQFRVNDIEIQRRDISYTVHTLESLQQQYPNNQYYFILGADAFAQFDTWHQWEKIATLANLVVVSRHDQDIKIPTNVAHFFKKNKLKKPIQYCTINPISISATKIRDDIRAGEKNIVGLTQEVREYIVEHRVYTQRK